MPHLVEMHHKYAADGLVCMTVDKEDADPGDRANALKFLQEKGAAFPNFLLKDTEANEKKWDEKYPTYATPLIVLFNRKGEKVQVYDKPDDDEIEAQVRKLLAEK